MPSAEHGRITSHVRYFMIFPYAYLIAIIYHNSVISWNHLVVTFRLKVESAQCALMPQGEDLVTAWASLKRRSECAEAILGRGKQHCTGGKVKLVPYQLDMLSKLLLQRSMIIP